MGRRTKIELTILIALIIVIGILYLVMSSKVKSAEKEVQIHAARVMSMGDSFKVISEENEDMKVSIVSLRIQKRNIKEALVAAGVDINELKDDIHGLRNLISHQKVLIGAKSSGTVDVQTKTDTVNNEVIKYKFITVNDGLLSFDSWLSGKQAKYKYSLSISQDITHYYTRDKWYGKKYPMVNVAYDDPRVVVVNAQAYSVYDKPKWYETNLFKYSAGFIVGFTANSILMQNKGTIIIKE